MNATARRFVWLNVLGGAAVLASYALGIAWLGDDVGQAWGGVPEWLRPWYQRSMLLAAAGYFPMSLALLAELRAAPSDGAAMSSLARGAVPLFAGILGGSALWMPLTCAMLQSPGSLLWLAIRTDLAVVGLCSLAVLVLLIRSASQTGSIARLLAAVGAAAFCMQTTLLDAIVWPAYFSR